MKTIYSKIALVILVLVVAQIPQIHAIADSSELSSVNKFKLDDLLNYTQEDLDTLYNISEAGEIPNGEASGKAMFFPGNLLNALVTEIASTIWQGKIFSLNEGILYNRVLGFQAIKAKVFYGKSLFDGKESIIIDYQETSFLASPVRDEIRQIGPGLYLGRAYIRGPLFTFLGVNFALDFNK